MIKVHYQTDQESLLEDLPVLTQIVDTETSIKQASSSSMSRDMLLQHKPDDDHFLLHVVAMGDHEHYGPNKNHDTYPKSACERDHHTFVTNGHFFREHKNRDPKYKIGDIKASCYDPKMGRVELAVWGNKKLAAEEYEIAKSGEPLSFSMSCRVPGDVCNVCGNFAKTAAHYCDHMKHTPGQFDEEHQKYAYVFNNNCNFFDISRVKNPADRIAHYLEYMFPGEKSASADTPILGHQWAEYEGILLPESTGLDNLAKQSILTKLAHAEDTFENVNGSERAGVGGFINHIVKPASVVDELSDETLSNMRKLEPALLFEKLASEGVILPFGSFLSYIQDRPVSDVLEDGTFKEACEHCLPKMFRVKMVSPVSSSTDLFDGGRVQENSCTDEIDSIMEEAKDKLSVEEAPTTRRILTINITRIQEPKIKLANQSVKTNDKQAEKWASLYADYQISTLKSYCDRTSTLAGEELCLKAVGRNVFY